jgi:hypothetical protein
MLAPVYLLSRYRRNPVYRYRYQGVARWGLSFLERSFLSTPSSFGTSFCFDKPQTETQTQKYSAIIQYSMAENPLLPVVACALLSLAVVYVYWCAVHVDNDVPVALSPSSRRY